MYLLSYVVRTKGRTVQQYYNGKQGFLHRLRLAR